MDHSVDEREVTIPTPISTNKHANQIHGRPIINYEKGGTALVKYRECLKNHAASIGGNATDGCGEFMPSAGENGTLDSFKCSACSCHRNFHRKEIELREYPMNSSLRKLMIDNPAPHNMIMPIGYHEGLMKKKRRVRTKFSAEQKEKMLAFAERVGWKLQKQEESVVQQLCQEIGVKRRVLKVWMHNNKHHFANKAPLSLTHE